jgi:hypothetical protein
VHRDASFFEAFDASCVGGCHPGTRLITLENLKAYWALEHAATGMKSGSIGAVER